MYFGGKEIMCVIFDLLYKLETHCILGVAMYCLQGTSTKDFERKAKKREEVNHVINIISKCSAMVSLIGKKLKIFWFSRRG